MNRHLLLILLALTACGGPSEAPPPSTAPSPQEGSPPSDGDEPSDSIRPTVILSSLTAPGPTNINPIPVIVDFSESVSGLTESDFTVNRGVVGNLLGSGSHYTVSVTPNSQAVLVTLSLPNGSAVDGAGNPNLASNSLQVNFDAIQPTVVAVTSTMSGSYAYPNKLGIEIQFSEPVVSTGSPQLSLNSGGIATYDSGSGSDKLLFEYLPGALDLSQDLDYVTISSLGGIIRDIAGNDALLILPAPGTAGSLSANTDISIVPYETWLSSPASSASTLFGRRTAIFGDSVIVGEPQNNQSGTNSGRAYIYRRTGFTWNLEATLVPSDTAADNWFGWDVGIYGDTAVVGATNGAGDDAAYIFRKGAGGWIQEARLSSPTSTDGHFGHAVAIYGNHAVVSAPWENVPSVGNETGAIYFYEYNGSTWSQVDKALGTQTSGLFGISIDVHDMWTMAAGVVGQVLEFNETLNIWIRRQTTSFPVGFGSVSVTEHLVSGNKVYQAAIGYPAEGGFGVIRILLLNGSEWQVQQTIFGTSWRMGFGVAMSGIHLALPHENANDPIAITLFDCQIGTCQDSGKLFPRLPGRAGPDPGSISIDGNFISLGYPSASDPLANGMGIYWFR